MIKCYSICTYADETLDPDFSNRRRPPASVDQVNMNECQLICIGDLVQIYKKINFIGEKHTIQEHLMLFCTYIKHFCDNIPVGDGDRKFENCFNTHKTNTANLKM